MNTVRFDRWTLRCDREATRQAYQQISQGAPEKCGCDPCKNFLAQRQSLYPEAALLLFDQLGINPGREAEIYHNAKMASGLHLYGGWFHLVGEIDKGADALVPVSPTAGTFALVTVSGCFKLGFSSHIGLAARQFAGKPLVQAEFSVEIPWVTAAAEPLC